MRIAVLTELYAPSIGGQELFFAGLAKALQARGHTVDVYTIGHDAALPREAVIEGVRVMRTPISEHYKKPRFKWARRNWPAIFRYAISMRKMSRTEDYDFYLLNQWPLLHALTLPGAARQKAMLHWCEIRTGRFYRMVQEYLPRRVRFNAAISDSVAGEIRAASGRQAITLASGIDISEYRAAPRSERSGILVLGRVAEHKNIPMLIESFEILKAQGYAGRLMIAGDGPAMDEVRARIAQSKVSEDIELLGLIDDARKVRLLATSDLLAMPSKREGFPRVVAEAMASGLPVVTADYAENGTKDVVRHYNVGVVCAPGAAALAAGINKALDNWDAFSATGLSQATSLDWADIAVAFENHIGAICKR